MAETEKRIFTNVPFDPMREEVIGPMIMVSGDSLANIQNKFFRVMKTSGYSRVVSVEIQTETYDKRDYGRHEYTKTIIFIMMGTPVRLLDTYAECYK